MAGSGSTATKLSASDKQLLLTPLPANAIRSGGEQRPHGKFLRLRAFAADPMARVETGHRSACIGHLIIIALRTGRKLEWNPERKFSPATAPPKPIRFSPAKCARLRLQFCGLNVCRRRPLRGEFYGSFTTGTGRTQMLRNGTGLLWYWKPADRSGHAASICLGSSSWSGRERPGGFAPRRRCESP